MANKRMYSALGRAFHGLGSDMEKRAETRRKEALDYALAEIKHRRALNLEALRAANNRSNTRLSNELARGRDQTRYEREVDMYGKRLEDTRARDEAQRQHDFTVAERNRRARLEAEELRHRRAQEREAGKPPDLVETDKGYARYDPGRKSLVPVPMTIPGSGGIIDPIPEKQVPVAPRPKVNTAATMTPNQEANLRRKISQQVAEEIASGLYNWDITPQVRQERERILFLQAIGKWKYPDTIPQGAIDDLIEAPDDEEQAAWFDLKYGDGLADRILSEHRKANPPAEEPGILDRIFGG